MLVELKQEMPGLKLSQYKVSKTCTCLAFG